MDIHRIHRVLFDLFDSTFTAENKEQGLNDRMIQELWNPVVRSVTDSDIQLIEEEMRVNAVDQFLPRRRETGLGFSFPPLKQWPRLWWENYTGLLHILWEQLNTLRWYPPMELMIEDEGV